MQFKNNSKQRFKSIQGLRSFKDTLPKNIKKLINKRGHIFSETLNNWKHIAGEDLFKVCYPKAYRSSNKFGVSTLLIMVKRGHEIELEYSKKKIMDKMNFFFQNQVVERIKFKSFNDEKSDNKENEPQPHGTKNRFEKKLTNVENESVKKSLIELTKVFKTR
tara:strand:- start:60 stop:545 length:486 start_codon:yes stop_codon:yes gene_type:complete